jgi:hypothetical protein
MKRLRHPIRAIREPFGKAGHTVAICALVLALVGGAYAAGGLTKSQEKQVVKIAKKFAGKPGAAGAAGAAGPAGTNGINGKDGANGTNGSNGTSATTESFSGEAHGCQEGGVIVKSASPEAVVCNGKKGTTGFTETLPAGKSEEGNWSLTGTATAGLFGGGVYGAISFNVPLGASLPEGKVHFIEAPTFNEVTGEFEFPTPPAGCEGTVKEPEAESGNLCIFATIEEGITAGYGAFSAESFEPEAAGKSGAVIVAHAAEGAAISTFGDWVVTD